MSTAILGGTFNPVHVGHLHLAEEVVYQFGYDRVLLIPTATPPHKAADENIAPAHRVKMLEIALSGFTRLSIDTCEIDRGGISFSIDTAKQISERYEDGGKVGFVIGDDLIDGFPAWRNVDRFVEMIDLIVAHRKHADRMPFTYPHRYLENMIFPFSSSDIKQRAQAGKPYRSMVPERVYHYIRDNNLYVD